MKILNLYSGIGGNRKLWQGHDITSVEYDPDIAQIYKDNFPDDNIIIGDAHQYLLDHFDDGYDFIWSSPPCQSHSKMNKATRHRIKRFPDMKLYEEIIFLKNFYKGKWVVENVVPYYEPLIPGKKIGRHLFWCNFEIGEIEIKNEPGFINKCNMAGKKAMMDYIGIYFEKNIYYEGSHCPAQILRNCVHPQIGLHVLEAIEPRKAS